jgi:DHA1 family tetracycline resistance protein-like MFS transporter
MKKFPLLIVFLTVFIDLIGFGIVLPLLPNYARELGSSPLIIGVIAATFSLMQFFFAPIWGSISDRIGRRPVILISVATSVISYLIFSHANTIALLLFSRFLAGVGSANISTTQAYIADLTDSSNRSKYLGLIGAAFGLGFILGPPLGGILKTHYGIEYVGYVAAGLAFVDLILAFFLLPESLKEKKTNSSFKLFQFKEIFDALKKQPANLSLLINFLYIFAFVNMQVSVALLAKEHYKLDDKSIGYIFAYIGFISALIQGGLIGRLVKKFGERKLLLAGNICMFLGILSIPFIPHNSAGLQLALISLGFFSIGYGLITPTNTALASLLSSKEEQGQSLGILQSVGSLARIFGPFTGSILYGFNFHAPYLLGAAFLLLSTFFAFALLKYKENSTCL